MKRLSVSLLNILIAGAFVLSGTGRPVAAVSGEAAPATVPPVEPNVLPGTSPGLPDSLTLEAPRTAAQDGTQPLFDPQHVLVKFRSGVSFSGVGSSSGLAALDAILTSQGIREARPVIPRAAGGSSLHGTSGHGSESGLSRIYKLTLPRGGDVEATMGALAKNPAVEWAEPDYLAYAADTTPNDPLFTDQWGLSQIEASAAWDVVTGSQTVVIALLDSGLDMSHTDLAGKVWTNPAEVPGDGLDNDSNGYVDDVHGWDFVDDDNDPSDENGHGTQVGGIAAAATNNGTGMAGVCWDCQIMPVGVMQVSGVANYSDIVAGICYAADKGAEVINISLGGYSSSAALQEAVQYAIDKDAVVVAGAGNDNLNAPFYPAASPEVLAVAGTTTSDTKVVSSNYGEWVDVSAPGEAITSTFLGGGYGPANGTSFATAFVSGLAGLLRSQHGDWDAELVRAQIERTTDDIDGENPGYAGLLGSGRINAATAVSQEPHPVLTLERVEVNGETLGRPTPGETATLAVTLGNDWLAANGVAGTLTTTDPYVSLGQETTSFGDIRSGSAGTSSPAFTFTVRADAGYNYDLSFVLDVTANGGDYVTSIPLTVTTRSANEPVCGTVAQDTVWTNDKTYIVNCDVGVAPGYTLTIQAGTEVLFNGAYNLNVGGTLIADGTEERSVRFASNGDSTWGNITFDDSSADATVGTDYSYISGSILRYAHVEDTAGLIVNYASPYLSHISVSGGVGIEWTPGTLTVGTQELSGYALLTDSYVESETTLVGVLVDGDARCLRNTVGGDSQLRIGGIGTVISNTVARGGLRVGSGSLVLSNTVRGGLAVGNASEVRGNDLTDARGSWGLHSTGSITATDNRLVGNGRGIQAAGGWIQGNLIANCGGVGLELSGNATVISNTFTGNGGTSVRITGSLEALEVTGNNFEHNRNTYEIENLVDKGTLMTVAAQYNWWGTTDSTAIAQRIFDYNDDYNKGQVLYAPALTEPVQTAPAYVRTVTLTPESPVGVEEVEFDLTFSSDMDPESTPQIKFFTTERGTWKQYDTSDLGLAYADRAVHAIAADRDTVWFGTEIGLASLTGTDWETHTLPADLGEDISAIAVEDSGLKWIGTDDGVARFDGIEWQTFDSVLGYMGIISAIAVEDDGTKWLGTGGGEVVSFDGSTWITYTSSNSGLPDNYSVNDIAIEDGNIKWFGTSHGLVRLDDGTWTVFDTSNSGLSVAEIRSVAVDSEGTKWIGTEGGGLVAYDGSEWNVHSGVVGGRPYATVVHGDTIWVGAENGVSYLRDGVWSNYDASSSGLPDDMVFAIAIEKDDTKWFGTRDGIGVIIGEPDYLVDASARWLSASHFRAVREISAVIPRGTYSITVESAVGDNGMEIAASTSSTFTVDYAGAIGDTTAPNPPTVLACGADSVDTLSARWWADDLDGTITLSVTLSVPRQGGPISSIGRRRKPTTSLART